MRMQSAVGAMYTCMHTHTHTHTHTHVIWGKSTVVTGSGYYVCVTNVCDHYHPQTPNCFSFFKPNILIYPHLHMSSTEQSIGQLSLASVPTLLFLWKTQGKKTRSQLTKVKI